jgi:hypothetical protein
VGIQAVPLGMMKPDAEGSKKRFLVAQGSPTFEIACGNAGKATLTIH